MRTGIYVIALICIVSLAFIYIFLVNNDDTGDGNYGISVSEAMSGTENSAYSKADKPISFNFPEDHGAHNDFKLEWWYFTGNLKTNSGESFSYQFTIFRNALSPTKLEINSTLSTNQLYFAHLGLSDINNNIHYGFEKFARGVKNLAGASANPLEVRIEDWVISGDYLNENFRMPNMKISAKEKNITLDLILKPAKDLILHGNNGLSQKSNIPGNASYYYSLTRINTTGKIVIDDKEYTINGYSWMDREWSTSALSKNQKGWDWFSIQMSDTTELMYFRLRDTNSGTDFSKGTIIHSDGKYENLNGNEIEFEELENNKLDNGTEYPSKWRISVPKYNLILEPKVQIKDQEMKLSVKYYEGSIIVTGRRNDKEINGYGFVELTGYDK